MIELNRLSAIINKLSEAEIRFINKNISTTAEGSNNLGLSNKLFKYLLQSKDIDINQLYYLLYGKVNKPALKKLLQRMLEKILEILISRDMIFANEFYDMRSKEVFNIKRKLLYYDVLASHGVTNYALSILNQTISAAVKIEYYDYLIIALEKKLIKMSLGHGVSEYNKVYNLIQYYTKCNIALKHSNYLLRLYSSSYNFKQKVFSDDSLLKSIKQLKFDFIETKSKGVRINLYYLEAIYYSNKSDYNKCNNIFKELLSFIRANERMIFNSYKISCLINLSECEIMLLNFERSLDYLFSLLKQFTKNEFNERIVKELIFISYYYKGDVDKAFQFIQGLTSSSNTDTISSFIHSKRFYYLSNIMFVKNNYIESKRILTLCRPLEKDKDGWNIGIRLLYVLNNIELEKFNLVENEIENLRKYLKRIDGSSNYFRRSLIILRILTKLVNTSFDFITTELKCKTEMNLLKSKNLRFGSLVKSPEMIPFDYWFESKVKGIPYEHAEAMKSLKKVSKRSKIK